jgi:hypothetical protein
MKDRWEANCAQIDKEKKDKKEFEERKEEYE